MVEHLRSKPVHRPKRPAIRFEIQNSNWKSDQKNRRSCSQKSSIPENTPFTVNTSIWHHSLVSGQTLKNRNSASVMFLSGFRQTSLCVYGLFLKSVKQLKQPFRFRSDFFGAFLRRSLPLNRLFVGKVGCIGGRAGFWLWKLLFDTVE